MRVAENGGRVLRRPSTLVHTLTLAGLMVALLIRLIPDVADKPLHEDEAVAGLISMRPFGEMLQTVLLDRGGAPLHFMLAHAALAIDASTDALRWLSVVFAVATVPLCYDLARRLAGTIAGLTAAALAATSQLLLVYGTFGRMYALLAFSSAVAADLFVRALDRPRRGTALAAAAAALLPVAVHPFGLFLFAAEAAVAAALWRGRSIRAALPVVAVSLILVPFVLVDLRLSDRYAPEAGQDLSGGYGPANATLRALGGAAGGYGVLLILFVALACIGLFRLRTRHPSVVALVCVAIAVPPVVLGIASAWELTSDRLSPRHFIFVLPLWTAVVAIGATWISSLLPLKVRLAVPIAIVIAGALGTTAISDPRAIPTGERMALASASNWVRAHVSPGDMLYPYSPLFLASLPDAAGARAYPREPVSLARAAERTSGVGTVFVATPVLDAVSTSVPIELRRRGIDIQPFGSWIVLRAHGPFASGVEALAATARMLQVVGASLQGSPRTWGYVEQLRGTACLALLHAGSNC